MGKLKRGLLISGGMLAVSLGTLGIFLPVLPTTPFLLLAAFCFARSSEKFHCWLLNNKLLGRFIKNYVEKRGIPLKSKIITISLLWATITISAIFAVKSIPIKIGLFVVAIAVTIHLVMCKTFINE